MPAESGTSRASLLLPCCFSFLLKCCFLFLPPSPSASPPISGERWIRLSAQPSRPQRGGTAGLRSAEGALTDSTDNHRNKCEVREVGSKQLFPKCHHCCHLQHHPVCWYCSQWVRNRKDRGSKNHRKQGGRISGGDAYRGLARHLVRKDKPHSSSTSVAVKYLLWRNISKLQSGKKVRGAI